MRRRGANGLAGLVLAQQQQLSFAAAARAQVLAPSAACPMALPSAPMPLAPSGPCSSAVLAWASLGPPRVSSVGAQPVGAGGLPLLLQLARPWHQWRGFATLGVVHHPHGPVGGAGTQDEQQQQLAATPQAEKVARASAVLSQVPIVKLRQELDVEAEHSLHIPKARFAEMATASGAAADAQGVEEVLATLEKAGIVLRGPGNLVYLRAEEVAEMVMLTLPGGKEDAQAKLERVERELSELDKLHDLMERRSSRRANILLSAGLFVLCFQFAAFIYLTWWELSWDVMEPIAYIISLFYSILAYAYFLAARHAFDLQPMQEFWAKWFKDRTAVRLQFDAERHQYLRKLQDRYKRHLAHVRI